MPFQINQDRSVSLAFSPGPVVNAEVADRLRVPRRRTVAPDAPTDTIVARAYGQALQQTRARQATGNIPHHTDNFFESFCAATINSGHARNSFAKDPGDAFVVPATIAVNAQPDPHRKPLPGRSANLRVYPLW